MDLSASTVQRTIDVGWRNRQTFRDIRTLVLKELAGPFYGQTLQYDRPLDERRPTNLIAETMSAYLPQLVGQQIRVKCRAKSPQYKGAATVRTLLQNHLCKEIGLARTLRLATIDALAGGFGLIRTGIRAGRELALIEGVNYDLGQPYAARVDPDDFARDPDSRDPDEDGWRAYRFRTTKSALIQIGCDPDVVSNLHSLRHSNEQRGDSDEISQPRNQDDPIHERVELWEIIIYEGDTVLTGLITGMNSAAQWVQDVREYQGPERGPLHEMRLIEIPNNAEPASMCARLLDLHSAMARSATQILDQMARAKTAFVYRDAAGQATAVEMRDSLDQEMFQGDPDAVKAIPIGGVQPGLMPAFEWAREESANASGSASQLAGASDVAKTATGATYVANNQTIRISDLRGSVNSCANSVVNSLAWYTELNPVLKGTFAYKMSGGIELDILYDAAAKEGDAADFAYDTEVVQESALDPSLRQRRLVELLQVAPAAIQGVAQMGGNVEELIDWMAEEFDSPRLAHVFPTQLAMQAAQMSQQVQPGQAVGAQPMQGQKQMGTRPIDQTRSDMAGNVPATSGAM